MSRKPNAVLPPTKKTTMGRRVYLFVEARDGQFDTERDCPSEGAEAPRREEKSGSEAPDSRAPLWKTDGRNSVSASRYFRFLQSFSRSAKAVGGRGRARERERESGRGKGHGGTGEQTNKFLPRFSSDRTCCGGNRRRFGDGCSSYVTSTECHFPFSSDVCP
jgi:hypothetical protein